MLRISIIANNFLYLESFEKEPFDPKQTALKRKQNITLSYDVHLNKDIVCLNFAYDEKLIDQVKALGAVKWSQTKRCWYMLKNDFDLGEVFEELKDVCYLDYSDLKKESPIKVQKKKPSIIQTQVVIPEAYANVLEQRRYSENTKSTYLLYFREFAIHFSHKDLSKVTAEEVNEYILELIRERKISGSQQNQRINAIKFYFEKVLGRDKVLYQIDRPRKTKALPDVLSMDEIKKMIQCTENIKHKCIISLLYSAGLRRNELVNLNITDILSSSMLIKVRNSKGNKDRYVGLSYQMLEILRTYFSRYRPTRHLFEGQSGGRYSAESVGRVIKSAAVKAGIGRKVTPHMLRHSFATHHLEQGTDLRYIQEFLGHGSSKTTEIYTHVAKTDFTKFKNPLDRIYEKE